MGGSYKNISCLNKDQLIELNNYVVIIESLYYSEIKKQLISMGVKNIQRIYFEKIAVEKYVDENQDECRQDIENVLKICEDEESRRVYKHLTDAWFCSNLGDDYYKIVQSMHQYFDENIIMKNDAECLVDCGAYIGDTLETYMKFNSKFEKAFLFELDPEVYKRMLRNVVNIQENTEGVIQCYPYGVAADYFNVSITMGDSNSSVVSSNDKIENYVTCGKVVPLDGILTNERVTFIKMDIEGAEMSALKGAERIIKTQKPTLAICIYHSPEDMLKIPQYIKSLVPEYKIYIRHYTDLDVETVCYAIPEEKLIIK